MSEEAEQDHDEEGREYEKEDLAAIKLQALERGRSGRAVVEAKVVEKKTQEKAAVKLQCMERRRSASHTVHVKSEMRRASIKIEKVARGRVVREKKKKKGPLTAEKAARGLHTLGRCATTNGDAFLGLTVTGQGIDCIEVIGRYPHVETVDVSGNCIEDLTPLSRLSCLTALDASDNALTEVLDFEFPHCTGEWIGPHHTGSQLVSANFAKNRIIKIKSLSAHPRLRELVLDANSILQISGLDHLPMLTRLSLRENHIAAIDGLSQVVSLRELNLDKNRVKYLENLESLQNLETLTISHNQLQTLDGLKSNLRLGTLDASNNSIRSAREVEHLAPLPLLDSLDLRDNPCASSHLYRPRVLLRLPSLAFLDAAPVTAEEKVKAVNIHGAEGSDLRHRQDIHRKFFSQEDNEPFENLLPPFLETDASPFADDQTLDNFIGRLTHRSLQVAI